MKQIYLLKARAFVTKSHCAPESRSIFFLKWTWQFIFHFILYFLRVMSGKRFFNNHGFISLFIFVSISAPNSFIVFKLVRCPSHVIDMILTFFSWCLMMDSYTIFFCVDASSPFDRKYDVNILNGSTSKT